MSINDNLDLAHRVREACDGMTWETLVSLAADLKDAPRGKPVAKILVAIARQLQEEEG